MSISVKYDQETIEFKEYADEWNWEGYSNVSLQAVKKYIDRAKKVDFERFEAWYARYDDLAKVTVTSNPSPGEYWITKNGKREKISVRMNARLFPVTADNNSHAEAWRQLESQLAELNKKATELRKQQKGLVDLMEPLQEAK